MPGGAQHHPDAAKQAIDFEAQSDPALQRFDPVLELTTAAAACDQILRVCSDSQGHSAERDYASCRQEI